MPKLILDVPDYTPGDGLKARWDDGFQIAVRVEEGEVYLQANNAGLRSLARLLLGLTLEGVQDAHHWHLDDLNSLEEGSAPFTIMKLTEQK
ncbi:Imm32 family immunity protein [Deinococcus pimensis]|uniref:Imm32 family immunity protein n=1 Tax=Deinococcus pimensis TaxID=309888 RepID=UPI0004857B8D|nr:hypothetical protein [Deinococcus pimensis]